MTTAQNILDEIRLTTTRKDQDTTILSKINAAYIEVGFKARLPEFVGTRTVATVASTAATALLSTEFAVFTIRDMTTPRRLDNLDITQYEAVDDSVEGPPATWTLYGGDILIAPTPDAVYSLRLRVMNRLAALVAASTLATGVEYDEIITLVALAKFQGSIGDNEKKAATLAEATQVVQGLKTRQVVSKEHAMNQSFDFGPD